MEKVRSIKLHLSPQLGNNRNTFLILKLIGLFFLIQSFFSTTAATVFPEPADCEAGEIWTAHTLPENNLWISVTYGNGVFVAVAESGSNRVMRSTDGVNWTTHPATAANPWTSVTYGNGKFVAVAAGGVNKVMISSDGISWTQQKGADDQTSWTSITYGNGKFVAVGFNGPNRVMTSSDGINWTAHEGYSGGWSSVTYGNGKYVAVAGFGSGDGVMSSYDGINWDLHSTPDSPWRSVTYGNGRFVAIASETVMSSVNGIDWEAISAPSAGWSSVTYGNGKFLAVANFGPSRVMRSMDGMNWTAIKAGEAIQSRTVTYGDGRFVAVASSGVMTSECTPLTTVPSSPINLNASLAHGHVNISFTIESDGGSPIINYEYSLDGVEWRAFNPAFVSSPVTITGLDTGREYGISIRAVNEKGEGEASQEVTVTIPASDSPSAPTYLSTSVADGSVYISFDLEDDGGSPIINYEYSLNQGEWIPFSPPFLSSPVTLTGLINGLEYTISLRAVNAAGAGRASQAVIAVPAACDAGENWTAYSTAFTGPWQSITYGNGRFVALAQDGQVMSSEDGEIWSISRGADNRFWRSVTFGNGKFVAVSFFKRIISSTDGINWTVQEAAESRDWNSVEYGNSRFVAVAGRDFNPIDPYVSKQVMISTDGINWTAQEAAQLNDWISVTFGNGVFVAVARDGVNRVMTSSDGITWTSQQTSEDSSWGSVAFGNGRFVSVSFNKVMSSSDGVNWTGTTIDGLWGSVTYGNGKFVSVAGSGTNRVMSSTDGINWTIHQAVEDSGWSSVTYGQGKFLAIARFSDRVMVSECSIASAELAAPTNLVAMPVDSEIEIAFSAPNDGVSPITNYEYTLDGGVNWIPFDPVQTVSPVTITELTNGTEYKIILRAINSIGAGASSESVTAIPRKSIDDPSIVFEPIDVSLALDEFGKTLLQPQHILNSGSTEFPDGTLSFDRNQFDCTDIGENTVKVTITDPHGEVVEAALKVTVYDDMAPVIKAKTNIHVMLDEEGVGELTVDEVDDGSTDNCGIVERTLSRTSFDLDDAGQTAVIYTIKDASGNSTSMEINVTVDVILAIGSPEVGVNNAVKLYPNPTNKLINIAYERIVDDQLKTVEIVDINGRVILEVTDFDRSQRTITVDVQRFRAGTYMVRLISNRSIRVLKFNVSK